ncbi:hypothetical protein [Stenotrophomonas indicatrix]|uniref:hypothetical protein n=1 Tax=Stenotrophomonas indicatrix TaxID=2045451 RepID=UPI00289BEE2A|nr:hypothetical protein [Stenotrophomonas indicatrix]
MKLSTLCSQLLPGEACDDIDGFFLEIDDFEEVPIVSRLRRIDELLARLGPRWTSAYLLSLCNHLLSTVRIAGKVRGGTGPEMFLALSFTDFELHAEEGVLLPSVFYYPGAEGVTLGIAFCAIAARSSRRKSRWCAPCSKMQACSRAFASAKAALMVPRATTSSVSLRFQCPKAASAEGERARSPDVR